MSGCFDARRHFSRSLATHCLAAAGLSQAMNRAISFKSTFDASEYRSLGMSLASLLRGLDVVDFCIDFRENRFFIGPLPAVQLLDAGLNFGPQPLTCH